MKIGVVCQVFDGIAPQGLNSVGLVGHYMARDLARDHEVVVYGSAAVAANRGDWQAASDDNVSYRVMPAKTADNVVERAWPHVNKAVGALRRGLRPPVSTAALSGHGYVRAVAADVVRQRFDVVHVLHATQYLPALRAAAPAAVLVLNAQAEWFPQTSRAGLGRRLAHADGVIGCSDYVTDRLVSYVPSLEGRSFRVYDGVNTAELRLPEQLESRPTPAPYVLYVGGLSPHKGVHDLISAFVKVARQIPEVELRLVGPEGSYPIEEIVDLTDRVAVDRLRPFYRGRYLHQLQAMLPDDVAPRVTITGRIPPQELARHYASATIFAFPSVWPEGFGLPPVEAMAAGIPVVATRAGAVTETVVDGATGYLVDKGDASAFAERLVTLLEDEKTAAAFGAAGRARAVETFDWSVVGAGLRRVYEELTARRSR